MVIITHCSLDAVALCLLSDLRISRPPNTIALRTVASYRREGPQTISDLSIDSNRTVLGCIERILDRETKSRGVTNSVYSAAKTVADLLKQRNTIGLDVANEAISDFRSSRKATIDQIWHADKYVALQT
jgi:hypothetical protein